MVEPARQPQPIGHPGCLTCSGVARHVVRVLLIHRVVGEHGRHVEVGGRPQRGVAEQKRMVGMDDVGATTKTRWPAARKACVNPATDRDNPPTIGR